MQYEIKSYNTNRTLFVAEIDADNLSESERKGRATILAITNDANLRGANLRGANLSGANLICANLSCADLSGADLCGADLRGANLSGANLICANLICANLICANLSCADLSGADLCGADLRGANLRGANLSGANLSGANLICACGIISFGPIGSELRIGYAVAHRNGPRIQLGCFWGTLDKACAAIVEKYRDGSSYEALVRAACAALKVNETKGEQNG